jgi:hypothetical protein
VTPPALVLPPVPVTPPALVDPPLPESPPVLVLPPLPVPPLPGLPPSDENAPPEPAGVAGPLDEQAKPPSNKAASNERCRVPGSMGLLRRCDGGRDRGAAIWMLIAGSPAEL